MRGEILFLSLWFVVLVKGTEEEDDHVTAHGLGVREREMGFNGKTKPKGKKRKSFFRGKEKGTPI